MKRKANLADLPKPQLELPFGQQGAARNLAYYIGLCKVFAAYHKRWPTEDATREEFRAARVQEYDGRRIDRELRFPSPELEADPAYRELWERCQADGATEGVSLGALDPRYRTVLREGDIAELFATIALPGRASPGAVRYATGVPAHAHGELTLHLGETLRARALGRAGLDPDAPQVLANSFSVRVQATDELKAFIDRIGVRPPSAHERLADFYLLDARDQGRLYVKYQMLAGTRYAGKFDVDQLAWTLASVYAADPDLAALRDTTAPGQPAAPTIAAAPAPHSEEEFREQLAMLEPEGRSLKLPIQQLSRFADIRHALEKAGATYRTSKQQFDFEEGVDPAAVIERLLNGGAA